MANQLLFMPTPENYQGWTDARATSELAQVDHEGIIRFTPVGKLPFEKARIVKNLLADVSGACSEDLNTTTYGAGTVDAPTLWTPSQYSERRWDIATLENEEYVLSFKARIVSGTTGTFQFRHYLSATGYSTNLTIDGTLKRYSIKVLGRTGGGNVGFGVRENNASVDRQYEITEFQVENVTGQTNQNPSEYCPVWSNLVTDSIPDSTNWTTNGLTSITGNSIKSPSGAYDAPLFTENTTTTWHGAYSPVFSVTNGKSYTHSCYAKAGTEGVLQITTTTTYSAFDTQDYANFDLSNGVIGSAGTGASNHSITDVGNGWYFCTVDFSAQATVGSQVIVLAFTGNNTSITRLSSRAGSSLTLYIWGAAVAENFAADYMVDESGFAQYSTANGNTVNATTKVVTEATGSALSPVPYLVHVPAATNLVFPPNPNATDWSVTQVTLLANQAMAPDRTYTASSLTENDTSSSHYVSKALTLTAASQYVLSAYVKAQASSRSVLLRTNNEGATSYVIFDFASEAITESGADVDSSGVDILANGWYRIWFEYTSVDTSGGYIVGLSNSTTPSSSLPSWIGDSTSGIYVWGCQVEQSAFPTPIVDPYATVSKSRDDTNIRILLSAGSWYNASGAVRMDFVPEYEMDTNGDAGSFIETRNASVNCQLYTQTGGVIRSTDGSQYPSTAAVANNVGDTVSIGLRYDTTGNAFQLGKAVNGTWAWSGEVGYDGDFNDTGTYLTLFRDIDRIIQLHDIASQDAVATIAEIEAGLPVSGASNDIAAALQVALAANSDIDATGKLIVSQSVALTLAAQFEAAGGLDAALSVVFNAVSDVDAIGQLSAVQAIVTTMAANLNSIGKSEAALSLLLNISPGITNSASSDLSASVNIALATLVDINANGKLTSSQTLLLSVAADLTAIGDINSAVAMLFVITTDIANGASSDMSAGIAAALTTSYDISAISSLIASNQVSVIATPDIYGAGSLTSGFFITVTISGDIAHVVFIENNNLVFSEIIRGYEFEEIERGYTFS